MPVPVASLCTSRRPRMSQRAQALEVDLGVDFRCVRGSMPKNFSDFSHGCPGTQHRGSQAVSKQVGSLELGV